MVPDGASSRSDIRIKATDVRQSMPVQKSSDKNKEKVEDKQNQNKKIMVTMIDGGPVVATAYAVSKKEKYSSSSKNPKDKKVMIKLRVMSIRMF